MKHGIRVRALTDGDLWDVCDIDMREHDDVVYRLVEGGLRADSEEWDRPPRSRAEWERRVEEWVEILDAGGRAWGAYAPHDRMVGIIVLRPHLTDIMAQLVALFVSRDHRRTGIAKHLTQRLIETARDLKVRRVYVSATPSRSAIGFYQSQGFEIADSVHPELFAREPEDIHMVLEL